MTIHPPETSLLRPPKRDQRPLPAIVTHITHLWMVTGLIASMVAVGVALLVGKTGAPALLQVIVAIACGTLTAFALAPWRQVQALIDRAALLRDVTDLIIDLQTGARNDSIRELAARSDEVGALCQAVDDLLGTVVSQRVRTHSLKRTMNDQIRKETSHATAALLREAMTDSLTGLGNRRALEHFMERVKIAAPAKPEARLAALVIDVDDFKQLNDTIGHCQGDECLKFIGSVLQASTRRDDCAMRTGGDEFLVLFLERSRADVKGVAERMISLLRQMPWPTGAGTPPTVSIGIADRTLRELHVLEDLVHDADAAMYRAKKIEGSSVGTAWDADAAPAGTLNDAAGSANFAAA